MGKPETHYFSVENLSMGGLKLVSGKGVCFDVEKDSHLEVMLYSGTVSLRCVSRVIEGVHIEAVPTGEGGRKCVQIALEIIGIDEKGRKTLGDFLEKAAANAALAGRVQKEASGE